MDRFVLNFTLAVHKRPITMIAGNSSVYYSRVSTIRRLLQSVVKDKRMLSSVVVFVVILFEAQVCARYDLTSAGGSDSV